MIRLLKLVVFLVILTVVGLTGYAYLGDMDPDRSERVDPVTLDAR
ncbi:hypothetical protein [Palleronia caenipelagi]|nr:hypothetical protein [Palleronia caenipelagi]